jgi:aminoglycoside phosphotransferase (APT) family kinase protein
MAPIVARLSGALDDRFVMEAIPPQSAAALVALPSKTERWLDALDHLPQALCHWDAHRANLFSRTAKDGRVQTVAIDWAGLGWGPPGADLSKLLSQTVNFYGLDPSALPALERALFDHYLEGLRAGGWRGDRREVRFAYAAAAAVRLTVRTAMALRLVFDERARGAFERKTGQSFAATARGFGTTLPYYLALVDEADGLM